MPLPKKVKTTPGLMVRLKRGMKLFKDFSGHDGEPFELSPIDRPTVPDVLLAIGTLDAVEYTTVRDGKVERYRHDFKKQSRPLLSSSHDGKQLVVVGGRYNFTERGITDRAK